MGVLQVSSAPSHQEPGVAVSPLTAIARLPAFQKVCADKASVKLAHILLDWYETPGLDEQQAKSQLSGCTADVFPATILHTWQEPLPPSVNTNPNDPRVSQQWHIAKVQAPLAWDRSRGDNVVIAILDSGVFCGHPDLAGKCVSAGRDFINNDDDAQDDHGHGTHVAGIAAAATNNGQGVAGVGYNARILPVKVLAANGSGATPGIARGIDWASQQPGVKVINMSLGAATGHSDPLMADAIQLARSRGVAVIVAAGNGNTDIFTTPAAEAGAIGVAASTFDDARANFSNYGQNADVAAPGVGILSTIRSGGYDAWNGTSMASPSAAGVYALAAAVCPACSLPELERRLLDGDTITTDQPIGKRVNALRAVSGAGGPTLTPQPTFTPGPSPTPSTDFDSAVVAEINRRRAASGLPALALDPRLVDIAHQHNSVMDSQNCFAHDCPGEPDVWARLTSAGYPNYQGSEIIGRGCGTVTCMVDAWMGSTPHRAIILGNYTHAGGAYDDFANGHYLGQFWTVDFGRRSGVQPTLTFTPSPRPATVVPTATATATLAPQPTVIVPPTHTVPTATPGSDDYAVIIRIRRTANPRALADAAELCQMGYAGVACEWSR